MVSERYWAVILKDFPALGGTPEASGLFCGLGVGKLIYRKLFVPGVSVCSVIHGVITASDTTLSLNITKLWSTWSKALKYKNQ